MVPYCTDCGFDFASAQWQKYCSETSKLHHHPSQGVGKTSSAASALQPKKTKPVVISDDEASTSAGSSVAARIRAERKKASKQDAQKPLVLSKYSIGAASKKEARYFHLFLSQGGNLPLITVHEGQKYVDMIPVESVTSFDSYFRSIARTVPGWKANTKYSEDHGTGVNPRSAYFGFCLPLSRGAVSLPTQVDIVYQPEATVRDLLNKMAEVLTHEPKARWAIVLPVKKIVSYSSDEDSEGIKKESSKYLQVAQPPLKKLKSNENFAFSVKKEPEDDNREHKSAIKQEDNEEVEKNGSGKIRNCRNQKIKFVQNLLRR